MDKKGNIDPSIINKVVLDAAMIGVGIAAGIKRIFGRKKD